MKIFLALVALVGLSLGAYIYADIARQPANVIVTTVDEAVVDTEEPIYTEVITRTSTGYVPSEIAVVKGTAVTFKNESGTYHWPASDYHPAHTEYADFDPKKPLATGDEWTFVFDKVGEWGFHDHLKAGEVGTVYVQDPEEEAFTLEEGQVMEQVVE